MSDKSKIEWTDHTFNPWWGCVKVSPACTNCYAERDAQRRFFSDKHWEAPLKWNAAAARAGERHRVFCASMADVFEELPPTHPDWAAVAAARVCLLDSLILDTPHLDWLILTKRPGAMAEYFIARGGAPDNVVAMTTVENQEWAERRIPELLRVPARRRGLSIEPLLGAINLEAISRTAGASAEEITEEDDAYGYWLGGVDGIDWVIVGGESGPGARPMHPDWARSLRDQCVEAGVPFFFKQWGEWVPWEELNSPPLMAYEASDPDEFFQVHHFQDGPGDHTYDCYRVGKRRAGRRLDGRTWDEFPAAKAEVTA